MKKKWLASVLALLLAVTPITAYAEDFSGGDGWKVSFDGKKMTSTFKNTDIDDKIYEMEPGDTVDFHIQLKNEYKQTTDWYMTNKVLESLEDAQTVAEGGAYSYISNRMEQKRHYTAVKKSVVRRKMPVERVFTRQPTL